MNAAATCKERLRGDLKAAMQARASDEVRLLRALIAALDNAEAVPVEGMHDFSLSSASDAPAGEVPRRELAAPDVDALLAREIEARDGAADEYEKHGRRTDAVRLRAEAALIARYRA